MPAVVVCLPTYNERENLERMVRALGEVLAEGGGVLIIDDNSPDGTGEIADRLAGELRTDVAGDAEAAGELARAAARVARRLAEINRSSGS